MNQPGNNQSPAWPDPEVPHATKAESLLNEARVGWKRSDEAANVAEAAAHDKAQALAALQLAVLALPVSNGGAACDDDYVRIVESAKARIEEAGNLAVRDLAYRTLRRQRDEAIARANDAAVDRDRLQAQLDAAPYSTGYPVGDKVAAKIAEYRERTDTAEVERDTLHAGIRDWLTANSILAFDDQTPAEALVRHLNITATGYCKRAEHDVELVARALLRVQHSGCLTWEEESEALRGHLTDQARAAIEALGGGAGA